MIRFHPTFFLALVLLAGCGQSGANPDLVPAPNPLPAIHQQTDLRPALLTLGSRLYIEEDRAAGTKRGFLLQIMENGDVVVTTETLGQPGVVSTGGTLANAELRQVWSLNETIRTEIQSGSAAYLDAAGTAAYAMKGATHTLVDRDETGGVIGYGQWMDGGVNAGWGSKAGQNGERLSAFLQGLQSGMGLGRPYPVPLGIE